MKKACYLFVKRLFDLIVCLIILPLFLVVFVVIAIAIKIDDHGPIFYKDQRVGKDFKKIVMLKFRSMKVNSPMIVNSDGSTFNSDNDDRVTRVGHFLRRTSLDELPQILNVLIGQMSIVGPRASVWESKVLFEYDERDKMLVKPGITGYSQAYFRNSISPREKRVIDAWYANQHSLWLDLKILFKTVFTVFKEDNLYSEKGTDGSYSIDLEKYSMKKEKKLLLLGTSTLTKEIIEYAKTQGIHTIVTDDRDPSISFCKTIADEYWMINTTDTKKLKKECIKKGITGVFCGLSEFNIEQMIRLTDELMLPCYLSGYSWHFSKDKADFKKKCIDNGVPVAKDFYVSNPPTQEELASIKYPVVVKPVDQNGNRGISYCYNENELIEAIKVARAVSKSEKLVVEKMLLGKEWYSFYAIAEGEPRLIALNGMYAQPGQLKNLYSLTTTVSDNVKRFVEKINPSIERLLKEIKINDGIAWVQEMLDEDGEFYIIEMGYRLPGDMTHFQYNELAGFDTIKWMVDYSMGIRHHKEELPLPQTGAFVRCGCSYNVWTNKESVFDKFVGLDAVLKDKRIKFYSTTRHGDKLRMNGHVGTFVFVTDDCDEMCELIEQINNSFEVLNTDGDHIMIHYDAFDYIKGVYRKGLTE